MAKLIVPENYLAITEKFEKITEENQKLKEEIEVLKAYNEQMQNENSSLGDQTNEYKEWYEVAKQRVIKLETKLEAYKEVLRLVLKEKK